MGWLSWGQTKRQQAELIDTILKSEVERRRIDCEMEMKRRELDIRARELELANLESIHEVARKDREAEQKAKEDRRVAMAKFRAENPNYDFSPKGKRKRDEMQQRLLVPACRVCVNAGDPGLTAIEIERHHKEGHDAARLEGLN